MIFCGYGNNHPWRKIRVMIMGFSHVQKKIWEIMEMVALSDDNHLNCIPKGGITGRALREVFMVQF